MLWTLSTKQEVTNTSSNTNRDKQPSIEGHSNEHEKITDSNLNDMQEGLKKVVPVTETTPKIKQQSYYLTRKTKNVQDLHTYFYYIHLHNI